MNFNKFGRTAQLFDNILESGYYNNDGTLVPDDTTSHSTTFIPVAERTFTISNLWYAPPGTLMANFAVYEWDSNKQWLRRSNRQYPPQSNQITFTVESDTAYITLQIQTNHSSQLMFNEGLTALPFQPYMDWANIPHFIHNTSTDTLTTLPAVLYPNAVTATVGLKGDMVQTGTPTPSNPVDVQGVGVRTINIYDGTTSATNARLSTSGTGTYAAQGYSVSSYIPINPSTNYCTNLSTQSFYCLYNENKGFLVGGIISKANPSPRTYADAKFIRFDFPTDSLPEVQLSEDILGQDYEPYGYKIPILSASTTTPVYLGEVETTRRIKKYEFTGLESGWKVASGRFYNDNAIVNYMTNISDYAYCSHFEVIAQQTSASPVQDGNICFKNGLPRVYMRNDNCADVSAFTTWLQQLYSNGTPVTVWYVLAESETVIVNEPLMRIGDYADTVSGISIPVTAGGDTISVGTTLKPSEVTVNYKGWHPVSDVHERENGAWD